jgi:hypothetical protein
MVMASLYVLIGIFFIFFTRYQILPGSYQQILGVGFILYGGFRYYRVKKIFGSYKKDI